MWNVWLRARALLRGRGPQSGQTLAEYAFLVMLIAMVVVAAVIVLGGSLADFYNSVTAAIP